MRTLYRHRQMHYRVVEEDRLGGRPFVEFVPHRQSKWQYWGTNVTGMLYFTGTVRACPLELALLRPEVPI